jgi:hypothetical protein
MARASWDELAERFAACERLSNATPSHGLREWENAQRKVYECQAPIIAQAASQAAQLEEEDIAWFDDTLRQGDREKKFFVSAVFYKTTLDRRLLRPMLEAAIDEVDPSVNRIYVEPCMNACGARVVNETLLDRVEIGNDLEIAGAVNAMYWAQWDEAKSDDLADVQRRRRCLFLKTFVENENFDVRRSVLSFLTLDESVYPSEYKPLVTRAIEIARHHPDEYIRDRLRVQLGEAKILPCLPHRGADSPASDEQGS